MRLRLPIAAPLVLFLFGCFLSGCSAPAPGDAPDLPGESTEATVGGGPKTAPTCALASPAVIKESLAVAVGEPEQSGDESVITCDYANSAHPVRIQFRTDVDRSSFARERSGYDSSGRPTTDVAGLPDEAYASSEEFEDFVTNTLVARRGSVQVTVVAVASIEAETALAGRLFTALG